MISGHDFQDIGPTVGSQPAAVDVRKEPLMLVLHKRIVEPFRRITGLPVVVVRTRPALCDYGSVLENPIHPACAEYASTEYCRESWQLHLAELEVRRRPHWHLCDHCRLCAVLPVACGARCPAAVKFASPDAKAVDAFLKNVRLVQLLVESAMTREAELLAGAAAAMSEVPDSLPIKDCRRSSANGKLCSSAKVEKALKYVEDNLFDPRLSVAQIAKALGLNPAYLSNLFVRATGSRITCFIAAKRIERARTLLLTTSSPLKQISAECGFANPNWFCAVFKKIVGKTPSTFQRDVLGKSIDLLDDSLFASVEPATGFAPLDPLGKS